MTVRELIECLINEDVEQGSGTPVTLVAGGLEYHVDRVDLAVGRVVIVNGSQYVPLGKDHDEKEAT